MKKKAKFDFWVIASIVMLLLYLLFMVYPLLKIVSQSVLDDKTGKLTFKHFVKFFSQPYYFRTLTNSFKMYDVASPLAFHETCRL